MSRRRNRRTAGIIGSFTISAAASIALMVVYAVGGQPQVEGALLFVALGGISAGLVLWANRFMPQGPHVEEHAMEPPQVAERGAAEVAFTEGVDAAVERRGFLGGFLAAALGALGLAALFPIRSLGERPGRTLYKTSWEKGVRAVTGLGEFVRADELEVNAVLPVFPEGHTKEADAQVVLIRMPDGVFKALPGREDWTPMNIVAFSRVCTHAGCPVGLYQADTAELFCPCHQSVFFVPEGARPTNGPATRPLPQLPLGIDDEGYIIATGDFPEPVGPGFWRMGRA